MSGLWLVVGILVVGLVASELGRRQQVRRRRDLEEAYRRRFSPRGDGDADRLRGEGERIRFPGGRPW